MSKMILIFNNKHKLRFNPTGCVNVLTNLFLLVQNHKKPTLYHIYTLNSNIGMVSV